MSASCILFSEWFIKEPETPASTKVSIKLPPVCPPGVIGSIC